MKVALVLVLAVGCVPPAEPLPGPDGYGSGWTGPQGDPISGCQQDRDCGAQVCARNGECYPAASIRLVATTWTVRGEVASVASCTGHPDLFIQFATSSGDSFGYAPVPCRNGKFTIDKLPTSYTRAELGADGASYGTSGAITSTGNATIDIP